MSDIIKIHTNNLTSSEILDNNGIIKISENLLFDARTEISNQKSYSVPIAQLSTLGAGVSSLIPALRTVTQTTTINMTGVYQIANQATTDILKTAKNGNFWGSLKTIDGTSKFVQLKPADSLTATSKSVAAINPATMMMAVALFSIEQKLGEIEKTQKQIKSFLEIEKESEIEADVETLSKIITNYKLNWDNEHYVASNQ